jgi:hypothetical protein
MAIQEVDEDAEEEEGSEAHGGAGGAGFGGMDDDGVEEVDVFSPIVKGPGEIVEEIYEDGEEVAEEEGQEEKIGVAGGLQPAATITPTG